MIDMDLRGEVSRMGFPGYRLAYTGRLIGRRLIVLRGRAGMVSQFLFGDLVWWCDVLASEVV